MIENIFTIGFLAPVALLIVAGIIAIRSQKSKVAISVSKVTPMIGIAVSVVGAFWVFNQGFIESTTLGINDLGLSIRLDTLSAIMYAMVSIIALVVMRFSMNYLDGDPNRSKFIGKLAITVALVQLLVISGNIFILFGAWVATSMALHQLLVFYPERRKAKLAARKKFIVARIGDASFLAAITLLYLEFGSGNLEFIFTELKQVSSASIQLEVAAMLLVVTAGLKSAQIPFHGWLLEVMEAPTPVSALLHAGLLNAGPFLLIRFSYLLDAVSFAPIAMIIMGAASAFYGAVVFTTQPSVKTGLAYSSIGHMGFSFLTCGLGVYSASLLHLVAHSFYKAHSFLSSGSMIEKVRTKQASTFTRKGSLARMVLGIVIAFTLFIATAMAFGVNFKTEYQLLIIGGVILTGIIGLLINAMDSNNYGIAILKIIGATVLVLTAFFSLEEFMRFSLGDQVPAIAEPSQFIKYLSGAILGLFFITVITQTLSPVLQKGSLYKKLGVHVRNGFYLNVVVDRLINSINHKN